MSDMDTTPPALSDADDAASDVAQYVESSLWALRRGDTGEARKCLELARSAVTNAAHLIQQALDALETIPPGKVSTAKDRLDGATSVGLKS